MITSSSCQDELALFLMDGKAHLPFTKQYAVAMKKPNSTELALENGKFQENVVRTASSVFSVAVSGYMQHVGTKQLGNILYQKQQQIAICAYHKHKPEENSRGASEGTGRSRGRSADSAQDETCNQGRTRSGCFQLNKP
ncbi:Amiloride-Sensitive Sodium Channel Subunit Alpha [Manis pentadactyla]|nr:Amiloride-Sensitive Sodium Channel Subunit Alpha [Manis pentadactyla]